MGKALSRIYTVPLLVIFLAVTLPASSQVRVTGKVMDSDTRLPLSLASVSDRQAGTGTLTSSSGNFSLQVQLGDWVVFSFLGYGSDSSRVTFAVRDSAIVVAYLRKSPFALSGVNVTTRSLDYQRDSMERRYLFGSTLDEEKTRGFAAVAHPISALYDLLSKKQRRVWKFQEMYRDYENEQYILSRIRLSVLQNLTGLQGGELDRFLGWYKPDYNYVRNATDYELYKDIQAAAIQFRMMMKHDTLFEPPDVPDQDN